MPVEFVRQLACDPCLGEAPRAAAASKVLVRFHVAVLIMLGNNPFPGSHACFGCAGVLVAVALAAQHGEVLGSFLGIVFVHGWPMAL